jgi:hypothetical protein
MTWRKWLVRGLVFSLLGGGVAAWLVYEAWTNPTAMRHQVLDKLRQRFVGAAIRLESARLRLLGGIGVSEMRMARRDGLDSSDFLYVPSAVIYHDKEHLFDGVLAIRKIEMTRPCLRVVRQRDGRVNLAGILGPVNLSERMPTLIIHQGTIVIEDHTLSPAGTLIEITGVELTAVNDPQLTLVIDGSGQTDVAGPVHVHATLQRDTSALSAVLELSAIPVGPTLVERVHSFCPTLASHLRQFQANGKLTLQLASQPHSATPLTYDLTAQVSDGGWTHAVWPTPVEKIEGSLRCIDGRVCTAEVSARSGGTRLHASLENLNLLPQGTLPWEERVGKLCVKLQHLMASPELFDRLPAEARDIDHDYTPRGPVSLTYTFEHFHPGSWNKHWSVHPEGMTAEHFLFPYRLVQVTGSVEMDCPSTRDNRIRVDLLGHSDDVPVTVRGTIEGPKQGCGIDLTVAANNLPMNEKLFLALPAKSRDVARTFLPDSSRHMGLALRPMGLGDVRAYIRRSRGQPAFKNRYVIDFHDAAVRYDIFPYPLEQVSGTLDIRPDDHWEFRNGHGTHKGGEIHVEARSFPLHPPGEMVGPAPAERRDLVKVSIRGHDILLDPEFEQALAPPGQVSREALQRTWHTLALQGRLSFAAEVLDHPDHPQDLDVGVDVHNCSMRPDFFPYPLTDVGGSVRYARGRVLLTNVRARHGTSQLALDKGVIDLKPGGGFTAWFRPMRGLHLTPDEDFLRALPAALRKGLRTMQIHTPLNVHANLTFDTPPEPGRPLKVWWEGSATLQNNTFQAGLPVSGVYGEVTSEGYHNGLQIERQRGYILLDRATVLNQPLRNVRGRVETLPETPDVIRLRDFQADLFGGTIGGEARVQISYPLRYEVLLEAIGVRLEQFGKHNLGADADMQGPLRAALHLFGEGDDLSGLHGNGRVDVPSGKMYRLPVFLDLVKAIGLRVPDRTAFEQARMIFAIDGPRMRISQLDLYGNAISLRGQGSVNLDGSNIQLDFNADWARVPQMLPPGISDFSQGVSNQILKIKMRGKLGAVRFEKEWIPSVVEPIKKALGGGSR